MNPETIKALLDAFDRSDWQEMTVTVGTDRLYVSRDPSSSSNGGAPWAHEAAAPAAPSAPAPSAPAASAPAAAPPSGTLVESPSVGLFWRAPSPGAPPFVEEGARVEAGDTLAIVEVMKLMNHLTAPVAGTVSAILVENGEAVEFGQPLVAIDPEG